jgi:arginine:ornithine antiporter/lysine permease
MTAVETPASTAPAKMTLLTLTGMVVGSMVGAGVFSLPARFGATTGGLGAIIAWVVAGVGMLMLAFVFQTLAIRKPDLDAGIFAYAKAGFGDYVGFNSAFGYWASACVGNTFYWVFIMTTVGAAVPALGHGDTILAAALSTIGIWIFHLLIARGVKDAAVINRIVTIAKLVPILVFIVVLVFAIKGGVFADNFWGGEAATVGSVFSQVKATMIITVFVFLGIEGASVYSRYAQRREDVAAPPCSDSSASLRSSPWSPCCPTASCRARTSPRCGSRRWHRCSNTSSGIGVPSSSVLGSSCRCSARTWPGR